MWESVYLIISYKPHRNIVYPHRYHIHPTMQRQLLLSAAIALSNVASVAGQAAATTSNSLNNFIGAAGAAASVVKSAASQETSSASSTSSSSSPTPTPPAAAAASPSTSAAPAHHGLSSGAKIGIIVGCVVAAILLLAILGLLCCCLIRRRHKRKRSVTPVPDREVASWKSPINPGRHYSNYTPAQQGHHIPMEQSPTVPLMAAAATEHHRATHSQAPSLSHHPAMRQGPENPFVPAPPSPRRTAPNSRSGLTDGTVAGADPYVMPEKQRLRDRSRSRSNSRPQSGVLSTHNDADRPPTPFGLNGFGTPAGQTIHQPRGAIPPYSGIGQPYEDMHVHVLQTDAPSRDLRRSSNARETAGVPTTAYDSDEHTKFRNSRGYSTPPEVPSRSPNREKRASKFADSSYESSLSNATPSNSSGEQYQRSSDPYAPAQGESMAPWEQHQQRFSNTARQSNQIAAPPIPWEESEYNANRQRRQSHSPRQSMQHDGRRRSSRSPATSINGQPRRLRFEDLQSNGAHGNGHNAVPGQHDSYDGYNDHNRWSQGVGEAL